MAGIGRTDRCRGYAFVRHAVLARGTTTTCDRDAASVQPDDSAFARTHLWLATLIRRIGRVDGADRARWASRTARRQCVRTRVDIVAALHALRARGRRHAGVGLGAG